MALRRKHAKGKRKGKNRASGQADKSAKFCMPHKSRRRRLHALAVPISDDPFKGHKACALLTHPPTFLKNGSLYRALSPSYLGGKQKNFHKTTPKTNPNSEPQKDPNRPKTDALGEPKRAPRTTKTAPETDAPSALIFGSNLVRFD